MNETHWLWAAKDAGAGAISLAYLLPEGHSPTTMRLHLGLQIKSPADAAVSKQSHRRRIKPDFGLIGIDFEVTPNFDAPWFQPCTQFGEGGFSSGQEPGQRFQSAFVISTACERVGPNRETPLVGLAKPSAAQRITLAGNPGRFDAKNIGDGVRIGVEAGDRKKEHPAIFLQTARLASVAAILNEPIHYPY